MSRIAFAIGVPSVVVVLLALLVQARFDVSTLFSTFLNVDDRKMSMPQMPLPPNGTHRDFIVIGAGMSGLQWGIFLQKQMMETGETFAILERNDRPGIFWETFPRGRRLISVNKRHVGMHKSPEFALRHDWNSLLDAEYKMSAFSKDYYPKADDLAAYVRNLSLHISNIYYDQSVTRTMFNGTHHTVYASDGQVWTSDHVIIATGYKKKKMPRCIKRLNLPSMISTKGLQVYDYGNFPEVVTGDEKWCKNKKIIVFGSGNSAFETTNIVSNCASAVMLAYTNAPKASSVTHYVGNVRARNLDILDRYQLKSLDAVIGLHDNDDGEYKGNVCDEIPSLIKETQAHIVIFAGGFTTAVPGLVHVETNISAPTVNRKFPKVDTFWADPEVPRKWYSGCLMHSLDYGKSAGGFIHGFRYLVRAQFRYIRARFYGYEWPKITYPTILDDAGIRAKYIELYGDDDDLSVDIAKKHEQYTNMQRIVDMDQRKDVIHRIISRVQNSSALYQMQEVLFDVVDLSNTEKEGIVYYEEVPRAWINEVVPFVCRKCLLVGLQYSNKDVWNFELMFDESRFNRDPGLFLHPVFIAIIDGEVIAEEHISEDLDFEFVKKRFVDDMTQRLVVMLSRFVENLPRDAWKIPAAEAFKQAGK